MKERAVIELGLLMYDTGVVLSAKVGKRMYHKYG